MTYIIGGIVVVLVLALGYLKYLHAGQRKYLETLAGAIQALRRASAEEARYRPFTTGDAELLEPREGYEAAVRELGAHGFTVLGDKVEERPDGTPAGVSRWFVDASRTVFGWFGMIRSSEGITPVMLLFSESDAGSFFVTNRGGPTLSVAQPPFIHKGHCEWNEGLDRQLEHHNALLSQETNVVLRMVESIDDAVGSVIALRRSVTNWRAQQTPAFLLDQDVRCVLENRFEEDGPDLIEFMSSAGAPAAT